MLALRPKSTIATSGASGSVEASPTSKGTVGETASTKSWSSQAGTARARAAAAAAVHLARRRHDAAQAAVGPEVAGEGPRVDARDRRDPLAAQERRELARLLGHRRGRGGDDEGPQPGPLGLVVGPDAPVVADQRVGHHHDLAGIRRVGADLLVAGLARVDHQVAARGGVGAEGDAGEDRPVLERQQCRPARSDARVDHRVGVGERRRGGRRRAGPGQAHGVPDTKPPPARRARWTVESVQHALPPFRPHGTGTPASQDRPQRTAVA